MYLQCNSGQYNSQVVYEFICSSHVRTLPLCTAVENVTDSFAHYVYVVTQ